MLIPCVLGGPLDGRHRERQVFCGNHHDLLAGTVGTCIGPYLLEC